MCAEQRLQSAIRVAEEQLPGGRHPEPHRRGARLAHALLSKLVRDGRAREETATPEDEVNPRRIAAREPHDRNAGASAGDSLDHTAATERLIVRVR
jgi:hypothetical protein